MATSAAYNNGSIYSIVAGSGETLGTGAQLLNHNFTELYDMVRPETSVEGFLVNVPTMYEISGMSCKAQTFALPTTSSLSTSKTYIATYHPYNGVHWSALDTGGSSDEAVSELTHPGNQSAPYYYWQYYSVSGMSGSGMYGSGMYGSGGYGYWDYYYSTLTPYQKTYKTFARDGSVKIKLPSFGAWFVTGTVFFVANASSPYDFTEAKLVRMNIYGNDSSVYTTVAEVSDGSGGWTECTYNLNTYISNSTLNISYSGIHGTAFINLTLVGEGSIQASVSTDIGS